MSGILILLDNGHGVNTPGKCSPDCRLREYRYCRKIAQYVSRELSLRGFDVRLLVPEETDIKLSERVRRVNAWCAKFGAKNVLLISVHNNAAGADGKWHSARGFSVFVSANASANSKRLASIFTEEAVNLRLNGNRSIPKERYWVQSLAMTRDTKCPAVLTENLFQDNKEDVAFLLSEEGKQNIIRLHVNSIIKYLHTIDEK